MRYYSIIRVSTYGPKTTAKYVVNDLYALVYSNFGHFIVYTYGLRTIFYGDFFLNCKNIIRMELMNHTNIQTKYLFLLLNSHHIPS